MVDRFLLPSRYEEICAGKFYFAGRCWRQSSDSVKYLIKNMMATDHKKRLTIEQVPTRQHAPGFWKILSSRFGVG